MFTRISFHWLINFNIKINILKELHNASIIFSNFLQEKFILRKMSQKYVITHSFFLFFIL